MQFHYIAVEGVIGVGKTAVVERLAERLDANTVLEEWWQNPFLKSFYEGAAGSPFQAELFFLLSRYRQQFEIAQRDLFEQAVVADYFFAKDQIFARLNLDNDEYTLYQQIYRMLDARTVHVPDASSDPQLVMLHERPEFLDRFGGATQESVRERSGLSVPLIRESQVIGAFTLWRHTIRPFSRRDTFPMVVRNSQELEQRILAKFKDILPRGN